MHIAIIAEDNKKELMAQFCIAYCGILAYHHLYATHITGKYISDATGLDIETFLSGRDGGIDQITAKVSYNEIDLLFYFRNTDDIDADLETERSIFRYCDMNNIPFATNIATAEALIMALDAGNLSWRDLANPISDYNRKKKAKL